MPLQSSTYQVAMATHEHEDDAISDIEGSSLFSDGDSDIINSPADGYFSQRSHPQQLYVQNETSAKVQEATRPSTTSQHTQYQPSSSHPPVWTTEETPLLDAGPAPPDYYAATADRRATGREDFSSSSGPLRYGSVAEGEESENARHTPRVLLQAGLFGSNRAPESMINSAHNVDEESQATIVLKSRRDEPGWRRWIGLRRVVCFGVLVLAAIITFIVLVSISSSRDSGSIETPKKPQASATPTMPDGEYDNPHYPHDTLPAHSNVPGCSYSTFSGSWHYDFNDISNFTFQEALTSSYGYNVGGSIWIRPAPDDQIPAVRVTVSYVTSADIKIFNPKPVLSHDSIKLEAPELEQAKGANSWSCIDVGVAIDVRRGVKLEHWTTEAATSHILLLPGLFDQSEGEVSQLREITDTARLITIHGKINAAYWSSRKTVVKTVSGAIRGAFALRDLLAIETVSGYIEVDVEPKKADKDKPSPATFKATSRSGSIKVTYPTREDLPDRDYDTTVDNISGAITGAYIHGTSSTFRSRSGRISGAILPFNGSQSSLLTTETISGATSLQISPPYDGGLLSHMRSKHESQGSGSIHLRYPDEWRGSFSGKSISGSIFVHGHDVEVDWSSFFGFFGAGNKVSGRKGAGNSFIEFSTLSGSANLGIGSE